MTQWQYCIMRVNHEKDNHQNQTVEVTYLGGGEDDYDVNNKEVSGFLEVIHDLGLAGWEMCGNFHYYQTANSGEIQLYYFKRPITTENPPM
ncbi:MAG: hypothetical protein AAFV93_17060 [Chloroflexota bacterium]